MVSHVGVRRSLVSALSFNFSVVPEGGWLWRGACVLPV